MHIQKVKGGNMTEKIPYTCDWCGKVKWIHPSNANGVVFHACSDACKHELTRKRHKEWWENLSPERRAEVTSHSGGNNGKGLSDYHKSLRPERVKQVIDVMGTPPIPITPENRFSRKGRGNRNPRVTDARGHQNLPRGTCTILAAHHEMMKDDPERLSTEFMQKICNVNCKCKVKEAEPQNE
jgi:hypothetical protein